MSYEIIRNDIINMITDAIVNTANPEPVVGRGVDSSIHKAAGAELLEARKKIGSIAVGDAALTPAFALNARYVIHTVGPYWKNGKKGEDKQLASCYRNSLALAKRYGCRSISFPLISSGNYKFPKALALQIALREFETFLLENDIQIYLVIFGQEELSLSEKLFQSVKSYIDENYVREKISKGYDSVWPIQRFPERGTASRTMKFDKSKENNNAAPVPRTYKSKHLCAAVLPTACELQNALNELDSGFSETLLKLIDRTEKKDSEIYNKAHIDRKLFSKIRKNVGYKPSKPTALAFALALELDLDETKDLIARAGFALSHSSKFDVIVEYFILNKNYNIFEINEVLFAFDQPLIGS